MLPVAQRLEIYRFFAQLFRYPDEPLLAELRSGRLEKIAGLLQVPWAGGEVPQTLELLQEGYTGLFVARPGGVPAPLYGSVYLDEGRLMGESTLRVAQRYSDWGLGLGAEGEPADFLSTELEFLYYLVDQEVEGLSRRQPDEARRASGAQHDFLAELLLPWLEACVGRLPHDAPPLYRWGGDALLGFVRGELDWLGRLA